MEIKIKNKRTLLLIITFAILLYWGVEHLETILGVLGKGIGIIFPFLLGGAIAFVINVPMKNIEERLASAFHEKPLALRIVSICLSFLLALSLRIPWHSSTRGSLSFWTMLTHGFWGSRRTIRR